MPHYGGATCMLNGLDRGSPRSERWRKWNPSL